MSLAFDITALAHLLREAAAVEIMPRFRRLGAGDIRVKSEASDLVTEADEAAERFIAARVGAILPGALFVGEESVAADPDLLGRLSGADLAITVDPVDGTYNFASGLPLFAVMAAVVSKGETVAGIIYDPMGDDWILAEKGTGAFQLRPDGHSTRLKVASPVPLAEMYGMASTGYLKGADRATVLGNMAKLRFLLNYRCAGHEYRTFSAGHAHFLMYNKLMPWDHLPGALIAEEAGAHVARFDGARYQPHHLDGGLIIAPDRDSWEMLRREVFTV
jgi:fructose-1,6-bisphosphatase/inositol monophosphatase family enzyme